MDVWKENKVAIVSCGAALLVLLVAYVSFLGPMRGSVSMLTRDNEEWSATLGEFYPEGGTRVETLKSTFKSTTAGLRGRYRTWQDKMKMMPDKPFVVPAGERQPGFYFRRLLTKTRDELLFYTSTRGMESIDGSLGFGEDLPSDDAVPGKLGELAGVCELVKLAADSGIRSVRGIRHAALRKVGAPGYVPFIEERGISLSIVCDLESLMKFLHGLERAKYFFGLTDLSIQAPIGGDERLLGVGFACATFGFIEPEEPVEKPKRTRRGGRRMAPGYR